MSTPIFPAVGEDGKIRENHLPDRLSESALAEKIESVGGGGSGVSLTEDPDNPGLYLIGT